MKIDKELLKQVIKDWNYILTSAGNKPHNDWLFFAENKLFAYNGYFYISTDYPIDHQFALNANCLSLLDKDIEVGYTKDASFIQAGKRKIEYSYPFIMQEKVDEFLLDQAELSTLVPEDIHEAFKYVEPTNVTFSNVYVHEGCMYSTNSYFMYMKKTKCINTVLPYGIQKIVKEDIRGIRDFGPGITVKFGNYLLSAMKTNGEAKDIIKLIPLLGATKKVVVDEYIIESLTSVKKFASEFKKKDIKLTLDFGDNIVITIEGVKSKFEDHVEYTGDVKGLKAKGHPDHLLDFFSQGLEFRCEGQDFFIHEDRVLWIGG